MYGTVVLGVLLFFSPLVDVTAEKAASVVPGARVRIMAPSISTKRVIGQITAIDADTLELRPEPSLWFSDSDEALDTLRVSFDSLTGLEVSQGRGGDVLMGGIRGLVVGAGVVVLLGQKYDLLLFRIAPISMTVGAVTGALIAAHRERWKEVHLDRIHIGIAPQSQGGIMLSASVAF